MEYGGNNSLASHNIHNNHNNHYSGYGNQVCTYNIWMERDNLGLGLRFQVEYKVSRKIITDKYLASKLSKYYLQSKFYLTIEYNIPECIQRR
jgi:hypothetical protein